MPPRDVTFLALSVEGNIVVDSVRLENFGTQVLGQDGLGFTLSWALYKRQQVFAIYVRKYDDLLDELVVHQQSIPSAFSEAVKHAAQEYTAYRLHDVVR